METTRSTGRKAKVSCEMLLNYRDSPLDGQKEENGGGSTGLPKAPAGGGAEKEKGLTVSGSQRSVTGEESYSTSK